MDVLSSQYLSSNNFDFFLWISQSTDYGHPARVFFCQKFETFGLGHTNWAEILWGIWGISGQTINTTLALWVPCPWESVAGSLSKKNFLGLNHITLKCSQNKILAVKNLGNSVHTSVFGVSVYLKWDKRIQVSFSFLHKTVCAAEKNTRMTQNLFVHLCAVFFTFFCTGKFKLCLVDH